MLLHAGALVPSVLTLSSGAAAAVASNLRCTANTSTSAAATKFSLTDDTWYRKQVYQGKNSGAYVYCIMNPQSGCIAGSNAADGSTWIKADAVTKLVSGPGNQVTNTGMGPYGLVYVSSDGKYITLDPTTPGYQAVSDSCAASMGAATIKSLLG
jgi:hypothetical protein